jgi:hypothetical protein
VISIGRQCQRHRPVLIDFVDHGAVGPETGPALRHLDRCLRCTEAIESTILAITAIRRYADHVAGVEPPVDAWPRLRDRVVELRRPSVVRSPIAGLAMSFAIVAVLAMPLRLSWFSPTAEPGASQITNPVITPEERRVETAYLAASRRVVSLAVTTASIGIVPASVPREVWDVRKEVYSAKPSGRPPEPI